MSNKKRVPKADYFRMRYQNAVDNNLTEKATYYESRLIEMNEPTYKVGEFEVHTKKLGLITEHQISFNKNDNTMRIYSF